MYEVATFCKAHKADLDRRLIMLSTEWPAVFSPFKHAGLSEAELQPLRDFHCREARCFKPSDRGYVLQAIREEWGSEAALDQYVQTELPPILAACKRQYSMLLVNVTLQNIEYMVGE